MNLIRHTQVDNFHHFLMSGEKDTYALTVIKPPVGFHGQGWNWNEYNNGHFLTVYENRNTLHASYHAYGFHLQYFTLEHPDYLPHRLGVPEENKFDFLNCVNEFIYPILKQYTRTN